MNIKANITKRLLAGLIDFSIAFLIYWLFTDPIGKIASSLFILFRDSFPGGKSVGKMVISLSVEKTDENKPATYRESILRNFFFAVPVINIIMIVVELFFIFQDDEGLRLGDKIAMTKVIEEIKTFDESEKINENGTEAEIVEVEDE